jgi:aryl-alcohol dehydrogenase-like predicted oxidoreductase
MHLKKELIFWDTAEMYSVPAREETYGDTERIIGTWFKKQEEEKRWFSLLK